MNRPTRASERERWVKLIEGVTGQFQKTTGILPTGRLIEFNAAIGEAVAVEATGVLLRRLSAALDSLDVFYAEGGTWVLRDAVRELLTDELRSSEHPDSNVAVQSYKSEPLFPVDGPRLKTAESIIGGAANARRATRHSDPSAVSLSSERTE